ncbi:cell division protein [Brevundimonas vesicularis]|uniref:cell division protein FtsL n=1 Tax=Brevundimonas vesicularis TaxID=41276 RepID=UPI0022EC4D3B|nr:cell division protein [Brevundimonas vesicularis]WBT05741.1 cell division protein [Brevundimonas vesicularis]
MTTAPFFTYSRTALQRLFDWKVRGVRWVEIIGVALVAIMIVSVYAAKAAAARESSRIAQIEQDIRENGQRVRLLRAEVARLEQPARLESLSRQIGMAPVAVARQAKEGQLTALKPVAAQPAAPAPSAAPAPAAVADDAPVPTPSPEPAQ